MNELNKYNIINDLVLGKFNKNRASFILNLTRRQINLSLNSKMKGKLVLFMVIEIKKLQLLFLKKLVIK